MYEVLNVSCHTSNIRCIIFIIYYFQVIENAHVTPPRLDVFLRSGCYGVMQGSLRSLRRVSGLVAAWPDFGSCRERFYHPGWTLLPPDYTLNPSCRFGVSLGPQEPVMARSSKSVKNVTTWILNWLLGHT